jgi:uncharacterized membrane protein
MENAKRDIWIGGATISIAALGYFVVIPLGVDVPKSVTILALSPNFWPNIIMGMLAACGLVVLIQGNLAKRDAAPATSLADMASQDAAAEKVGEVVHYGTQGQFLRVSSAFIGLFAFYFLSPYIGVVVGSMILVLASTRTLGVRSWAKSITLAVLLPGLLYFFFTLVAQIPIPLGLLEELR